MDGEAPETCWATHKRQVINLWSFLHLVGWFIWIVCWCMDLRTSKKYNNKFCTPPFQYTLSLLHLSLFHHALLRLWSRSSVNYYQRREAAWFRQPSKSLMRCITTLKQRLTFTCRNYWYYIAELLILHNDEAPAAHQVSGVIRKSSPTFNPLNSELNPICCLLALLGAHHFLHVSRIRVKLLTFRLLMSLYIYIYGAPILDVSRSHTMTQHSR